MNINWIDTHGIYRSMITARDNAAREQIYIDKLLTPWNQMMAMVAGQSGDSTDDPFAGARAWYWLLPNQLQTVPDALARLEAAHAWETGAAAMQKAADYFADCAECIPIECIEGWLVLADAKTADPIGRGYTGGIDFMQPRFIVQYDSPNDYNLPRLGGCIVHEMHHLIRSKVVPWNMMTATVADYIIHEGLAESFAAELFGEEMVGYYVTEFDDTELDTARTLIGDNLTTAGFDTLRAFIFGDYLAQKFGLPTVGMPDYGGYAIGYRVVQAYLKRTGKSVKEATFIPAAEIVAESEYFD